MTNITLIFCRIGAYCGLDLKLLEVLEYKIEVLSVIVGEENSFFFLYSLRFGSWGLQIRLTEARLTGAKAYRFYSTLIFYFLCAWRPSQKRNKDPKEIKPRGLYAILTAGDIFVEK